jgi:O-antigen/teichoic acid export membrane protein
MFKINTFFNETLKNASKLLVGTVVAQIVPIVFSFYIARIFSDESFGFYGIYMSSVSILFVIVNLKYDTTILLPKEEKDANALVVLSVFFAFLIALLILIGLLLYKFNLLYVVSWSDDNWWMFLVPLSVFFVGVYQPFNYWLIRKKKYTASSLNKITQRVVETPFNILFGKTGILYGLIYGDVIGRFAMAVQAIYQSFKAGFSYRSVSKEGIKGMLKRYKSFALINSLPSLANAFATHAPLFIVTKQFGIEIAGQLTLVRTILSIPVSLISNNVSQVVFQQVSERVAHQKEFKSVLKNVFLLLIGLSVGMSLLFIPFGTYIFKLYGDKWDLAGFMSQILVISFSFKFLVSSFSKILLSLEKIKWISIWQVVYLVMVVLLYLITAHYDLDLVNFLYCYLAIDLISYLIYAGFISKAIKDYHLSID